MILISHLIRGIVKEQARQLTTQKFNFYMCILYNLLEYTRSQMPFKQASQWEIPF